MVDRRDGHARRALAIALVVCACSAAPSPTRIELVASVPVETELASGLPDAHVVWLDMIDHARTSIEFAEFYASNAPRSRLDAVVLAIERAIKRGVDVRFLAEKSFVAIYPDTLERLRRAGADVVAIDFGDGGIHHAKYFVVDEREAFIGSQNFDWRSLEHNLELGARIRDGAIVAGLTTTFAHDWAMAGGRPRTKTAHRVSPAFVASPRDRLVTGTWDLPKLAALLATARSTIRIELLTYKAGEWQELEQPLLEAARRGVAVELMLSDWVKRAKTIGLLQQLARHRNVTIKLVTIPLWRGTFIPFARVIHAKLLVIDGVRGWLGTSNWERDYFYKDRNVGILVDDSTLAQQLDRFFTMTWTSRYAYKLDPDATYEPPRIE